MKYLKKLLILLCWLIFLASCGAPPEGIKEVNVIYLIEEQLNKLNKIKDNIDKQKKYFKELAESFNVLLLFKKNTSIVINSIKQNPGKDSLAYTLDNNKFMTTRPFYTTIIDKNFVISLDGKTWYSTKNEIKNNIQGIKNDYYFHTRIENDNIIFVDYMMDFSISDQAKIIEINDNREIIKLKKGMIFSHKEEKNINTDLKQKILLVPENTLLHGNLHVTGNLIDSKTTDTGIISIKSLKDLYIYFNNMKLSMSFDKTKWDVSILSFEIEPDFNIKAISDNEIFFDIYASAIYDKDKKTLSVIKLLMRTF